MNYHSLGDFLDILEQNGQLVRIIDPIMPEPDDDGESAYTHFQ